MGVEDTEHALGDFRELIVQLVANAGVEVGERLDQPRDVRVLAGVGAETQAAGDLRMSGGKLGAKGGE